MSSRKQTKPKPSQPSFDELADSAYYRADELITQKIVPFSRSSLWRKVKHAEFPAPDKISEQITAFKVGKVRVWQTNPEGYKLLHIESGDKK